MKRILLSICFVCLSLSLVFALDSENFSFYVMNAKDASLLIPWTEDVVKEAKETGTLRFYFMSSEKTVLREGTTQYGDSCLVVFPNGETMLIDGGITPYGDFLVANLEKLGIDRIDYVLLSHVHEDHYGGLYVEGGVFDSFPVGVFLWSGALGPSDEVNEKIVKEVDARGIPVTSITKGDVLAIGDVSIDVLWPNASEKGIKHEGDDAVLNGVSLVLRFTYGSFSAIFGGDLYANDEKAVIANTDASLLDVDMVKANHHGKSSSNSKNWAKATTPKVVVSTNGTTIDTMAYGYYSTVGSYILSDNIDGFVKVITDGKTCETTSSRRKDTSVNDNYDKAARKIFPVEVKVINF